MNIYYRKIDIILNQENQPIGFLVYPNELWGKDKTLNRYEVIDGVNWQAVTPLCCVICGRLDRQTRLKMRKQFAQVSVLALEPAIRPMQLRTTGCRPIRRPTAGMCGW